MARRKPAGHVGASIAFAGVMLIVGSAFASRVAAEPANALESPAPSPVPAAMSQPFALEVGQAAVFDDGLTVRFVSVIEDSRCPADVVCVWEGDAEISVSAAAVGEIPGVLMLHTNPMFATEESHQGYAIRFIELEPYPRTDSIPAPYVATLDVEVSAGASPGPAPTAR